MWSSNSAGWEFWLQTDEEVHYVNAWIIAWNDVQAKKLVFGQYCVVTSLKESQPEVSYVWSFLISQLRTWTEKWKKPQPTPSLIFLMTKNKARNSKWSYLYLSWETRDKKSFIICATLVLFINTKTVVSANKIATKYKVLNSSVYQQHLLSFQSIFICLIFYKFLPLFLR